MVVWWWERYLYLILSIGNSLKSKSSAASSAFSTAASSSEMASRCRNNCFLLANFWSRFCWVACCLSARYFPIARSSYCNSKISSISGRSNIWLRIDCDYGFSLFALSQFACYTNISVQSVRSSAPLASVKTCDRPAWKCRWAWSEAIPSGIVLYFVFSKKGDRPSIKSPSCED